MPEHIIINHYHFALFTFEDFCFGNLELIYPEYLSCEQFGQVGVGDNKDHCFPMEVKFPDEQAHHFST